MRKYPEIKYIYTENRIIEPQINPNDWEQPDVASSQLLKELKRRNFFEHVDNKPWDDRSKNTLDVMFYNLWAELIQQQYMYETPNGWALDLYKFPDNDYWGSGQYGDIVIGSYRKR